MKDENLYLIHISECIDRIRSYVSTEQAFFDSTMAQDAVIRNLEIIGEAAKKLSVPTRSQAPDIPWKNVCGMRDVLIHSYMGVDLKEVWRVVAEDLGALQAAVERLRTDDRQVP